MTHKPNQPIFEFDRGRGVVWVCDIASSSQYLNSNDSVATIEDFLPRFHWLSRAVVRAAGGQYIKWTGDGFLAWFPTTLHRDLGVRAACVYNAAWQLTVLVNVTGLDVKGEKKFRIRHGVTFEQDALITKILDGPHTSIDLIGRAVVLAFRLSGVAAQFPGIVTQGELVKAAGKHIFKGASFTRWKVSADDKLKYFKGEKWGTTSLYFSNKEKPKKGGYKIALAEAKEAIAAATDPQSSDSANDPQTDFASEFLEQMMNGPAWCRATAAEYIRYIREDLLGSLKAIVPILEQTPPESR